MTASREPQNGYTFKDFKFSSHYWILKKLEEEQWPVRILDVGCAGGYLGKALRARGHYVVGIEGNPAAAEKASGYYDDFHVADIETFTLPYRGEFDYILFADVLEHLRDPSAALREFLPALKNSGKLIVSVPNVANWVVRLSLFFGHFDPAERGILDKTHLHFFTLRTLKKMVSEASCRILEVTPAPVPLQLLWPFTQRNLFAPLHALDYGLTRLWKTLFAYQFVVTAAPSGRALHTTETQMPAETIRV